jgi:hypothetical protein
MLLVRLGSFDGPSHRPDMSLARRAEALEYTWTVEGAPAESNRTHYTFSALFQPRGIQGTPELTTIGGARLH